jgi:hypothetical protein
LTARRDQLRSEITNLVKLVAAGLAVDAATPEIKKRETEIASIEMQLLIPRAAPPDLHRLRDALLQPTAEWKADLQREPAIARLVLKRLLDPIQLWYEGPRRPGRESFIDPNDKRGLDFTDPEDIVRWGTTANGSLARRAIAVPRRYVPNGIRDPVQAARTRVSGGLMAA